MPTVDDLVISLTIKETGRLGDFQKQLESVVGKRGEKALQIGQVPFELMRDVDYIRRRMDYLVPIVSPASKDIKALKIQASSTILQIQTFKDEIKEFLIGLKPEDLQKLYKDLNVEEGNIEDLIKTMDEILEDWQGELNDLRENRVRDYERAKRFNDKVIEIIRSLRQKGGERLTALREALKFIPEAQERWERIMEKVGIGKEAQFQIFKIKDEVISNNDKVKEWLDENSEDYEDLKKFFKGAGEDVTIPFLKALKQLGYSDKLKDILTTSKTIKDDTQLQNLVKAMVYSLSKFSETDERELDLYLPEGVKKFIQETVKPLGRKSIAERGVRRLDLMLFNTNKLLEMFPEIKDIIVKAGNDIGVIPVELKNIMDGGDRTTKQLEIYNKILGEYLIVISRMMMPKARKLIEKLGITGITRSSIRQLEKQFGIERKLPTKEDIKKSIDELTEVIKKEKREQFFEDFKRELKIGKNISKEDFDKSIGLFEDAFRKQYAGDYPEPAVVALQKMLEKSKETGFDYLKLVHYFGDIMSSLKEKPGEITKSRRKLNEDLLKLPQTTFFKEFVEGMQSKIDEVKKIPIPEILKRFGEDITNDELKVIIEKALEQYKKGSVEREQIKKLIEGFMNIIKKTTNEPGTQTGFPEG